ncbi:MAG: 2-oxoglutarate dehydrogenase E1 component [Rhodospirillales bacterium]|nr:2-oxoglutarate dehydrogenase E1 component [Rhodospirillales bacterium]
MAVNTDTFLSGANAPYISELYRRFVEDPSSVDPSWVSFAELHEDARVVLGEARGASWAPPTAAGNGGGASVSAPSGLSVPAAEGPRARPSPADSRAAIIDSVRALMLIRVYRVRGHLMARFDPLGLEGKKYHPELDPKTYGFTDADMDRPIFLDNVLGLETATLRYIVQILRETYCGSIGVEFMHIQHSDEKAWIQQRIEGIRNQTQFTSRGKRAILERLIEAEEFERFLHVKFTGTKRFGLDGGETTIPAIEQILKRASQLGVQEAVLGMAHRGRLNMLANIMSKPYVAIFSEFQGRAVHPDEVQGSGDVKYHLGTSADRSFDGDEIHLSLAANPSHLEAVDPVVLGKVRAKQVQRGDIHRNQVMGILIHGDAAIAGQGLAAECFGLSELKGYRCGGTIHVIINNQIGFTTSPSYSRSSPYCSDVAKMVQAPIFHVNGDDPEAVVHVSRIATEFRQEFKRDVVVDMFCYRRFGHNEADEPSFTQPIMYKAIAKQPTTRQIYAEKLIADGVVDSSDVNKMSADVRRRLQEAFDAAPQYKPNKVDWLQGRWAGLRTLIGEEELRDDETWVSEELLRDIGSALTRYPANFHVHRKLTRLLDARREMIASGENLDWAMGEALAFGALLAEGVAVRLSGQDSGRGTFSHRHAVLVDQENESRFIPLNNISDGQGTFEVIDSPLSEASVLGFEYGYSLVEPDALVIWEAQFGDFANGAQVIIDQFIAPGESKWLRLSGLVMLLPHGYEGQGPEHSSARVERYLQLCAEDNIQVVNCTTPANYFHALRRQIRRNFRKPLVVFSPKSLLRHKLAVSRLADFGPGTRFHRVLPEADSLGPDDRVRRIVFCSGKVYYDLLQERRTRGMDDVAIVRVEQLYPWPRLRVIEQCNRYPSAEMIWCQEEPANMGAWTFVLPRLANIMEELGRGPQLPTYVGRAAAASPATGLLKAHEAEQKQLVDRALAVPLAELPQPFRRITR